MDFTSQDCRQSAKTQPTLSVLRYWRKTVVRRNTKIPKRPSSWKYFMNANPKNDTPILLWWRKTRQRKKKKKKKKKKDGNQILSSNTNALNMLNQNRLLHWLTLIGHFST